MFRWFWSQYEKLQQSTFDVEKNSHRLIKISWTIWNQERRNSSIRMWTSEQWQYQRITVSRKIKFLIFRSCKAWIKSDTSIGNEFRKIYCTISFSFCRSQSPPTNSSSNSDCFDNGSEENSTFTSLKELSRHLPKGPAEVTNMKSIFHNEYKLNEFMKQTGK